MGTVQITKDVNLFTAEFARNLDSGYPPLDALKQTFHSFGREYLLRVEKVVLCGFALGSLEVRGRYRDYIFANRQGTQYVKEYKKPYNPRTPKQQANRAKWKSIGQSWQNLSESDKAEYNLRATGLPFSGFNLYVRDQYRKR